MQKIQNMQKFESAIKFDSFITFFKKKKNLNCSISSKFKTFQNCSKSKSNYLGNKQKINSLLKLEVIFNTQRQQ